VEAEIKPRAAKAAVKMGILREGADGGMLLVLILKAEVVSAFFETAK
jgi:hypothetical protein